MRAPMSFFDTTPIGRVLNRFSRDMDLLDLFLPDNFRLLVMLVGQILSIFIVVSISTPIFLGALIPMLAVFLFAIYFFLASGRQLRRLESVTRSPVFSFIAASIQGTDTSILYNTVETNMPGFWKISRSLQTKSIKSKYAII